MSRHGPADDSPIEQVDTNAQVHPATSGPDIGNVATPDLIGLGGPERTVKHTGDIYALV